MRARVEDSLTIPLLNRKLDPEEVRALPLLWGYSSSGRDRVKSLRSSYTGLYSQTFWYRSPKGEHQLAMPSQNSPSLKTRAALHRGTSLIKKVPLHRTIQ